MLNPVAMSIITNTFTDPRERAQAVGIWGAVFGISMALGPVLGGTVVSTIGWRAIFYINLPVGLTAIMLTSRFIPESKAPRPRRFDPVGQALVIIMLATLTYAIIEAPSQGWTLRPSRRFHSLGGGAARPDPLRAPPAETPDRSAVLRIDPVLDIRRHLSRRVCRVRRVPVPEHPLPPRSPRLLADPRRTRDPPYGRDDNAHLAALRPYRRPPRPAPSARHLRRRVGRRLRDADRDRPDHAHPG